MKIATEPMPPVVTPLRLPFSPRLTNKNLPASSSSSARNNKLHLLSLSLSLSFSRGRRNERLRRLDQTRREPLNLLSPTEQRPSPSGLANWPNSSASGFRYFGQQVRSDIFGSLRRIIRPDFLALFDVDRFSHRRGDDNRFDDS